MQMNSGSESQFQAWNRSDLAFDTHSIEVSPGTHSMAPIFKHIHLLTTMKFLLNLQSWLPELHNYTDEDRRHHIGFTWHGKDGLRDSHDLELRYTYNSERLALRGSLMPDGSWAYTEANGRVHTITAERAKAFMHATQESASLMVEMLDKLREAGVLDEIVETNAKAA